MNYQVLYKNHLKALTDAQIPVSKRIQKMIAEFDELEAAYAATEEELESTTDSERVAELNNLQKTLLDGIQELDQTLSAALIKAEKNKEANQKRRENMNNIRKKGATTNPDTPAPQPADAAPSANAGADDEPAPVQQPAAPAPEPATPEPIVNDDAPVPDAPKKKGISFGTLLLAGLALVVTAGAASALMNRE